jgi:precorrin-2 dehydrogenase / sirohydrochlorin ferrochelatase
MENLEENNYFPAYLNLSGQKCLLVGGGRTAERKVLALLRSKADVKLVSPEATADLAMLAQNGLITWEQRCFQLTDLEGCFLVISACNHSEVNALVSTECQQRNIPVNVVDDPARCSFIMPAEVRRGPLSIAISTQGLCPMLSGKLRKKLEAIFGEDYADYVYWLSEQRKTIFKKVTEPQKRFQIMEALLDETIFHCFCEKNMEKLKEHIERCMLLS